jgi:GT2 family glycosyltransferase
MVKAVPQVYIVLPVHDRRQITAKFVQSLQKQSFSNYHLLLIDDGCRDGTADMVADHISHLTVITGTGDWWWAGSLQQGFLWLQRSSIEPEDLILMINDDVHFEPDFLEIGVQLMATLGQVILGAQIYDLHTQELVLDGVYVDWRSFTFLPPPHPDMINCLPTNGIFMRWQTWQYIGGFYPRLLPHYISDYEFTLRAHAKGVKLVTDPRLRLYWNTKTTGYGYLENLYDRPFPQFLSAYFSRKSPHNPITLSIFIALICPWQWRFLNWGRVWKGFLIQCGRYWRATHTKG